MRDEHGIKMDPDAVYVECEYCGLDFERTHGAQRYCDICKPERKRAYARGYYRTYKRAEDPMNPLGGRTCIRCGEEYDANAGNQKRCTPCARLHSNEISSAYYWRKKAEGAGVATS